MKAARTTCLIIGIATALQGQTVELRETSSPIGIVDATSFPETSATVTTVTAPDSSGGRIFYEWAFNGIRQEGITGLAANPVTFEINGNVDAVAFYIPSSADDDADNLLDWWELRYWGDRLQQPTDSPDGDAFDNSEEFNRGQHPRIIDRHESGGFSMRRTSEVLIIQDTANWARLRQTSTPPGVINSHTIVATNAPVALNLPPDPISQNRFTGWLENGVRFDTTTAKQPISVTLTQDRHFVARYIEEMADVDEDGILDWREWLLFDGLQEDADSDPDTDALDFAEEVLRGTSTLAADDMMQGGFSMRRTNSIFVDTTGRLLYRRNSEPATIIEATEHLPAGTDLVAPDLEGDTFAQYRFAWYRRNGVREVDDSGAAVSIFHFTLDTATTLTAFYYDPSIDSDGDGISDWHEWVFYGSLDQSSSTDSDGDTMDYGEEVARGQSPRAVDDHVQGGFSMRRAESIFVDTTGLMPFRLTSQPISILEQTTHHPQGTRIHVGDRQNDSAANYTFAYYTLNGTRVTDDSGASAYLFSFEIEAPSMVVAHYVDPSIDSDLDGISDWHEQVFYGSLAAGPSDDSDLDGFDYAEELNRGQSARAVDSLVAGGFSIRRTTAITIEPELAPAPPEIGSLAATDINADSALLSALVNSLSVATTATFDYGTTPAFGNSVVSTSIVNGFTAEPMVARISGLQPDTRYFFRVTATNSEGVVTSDTFTFRTLAGLTGYQAWQRIFGVGGPQDDDDFDGVINLFEFGMGTHPLQAGVSEIEFGADANQLHLEFYRNREALLDGYVFSVEWTDDLQSGQWFTSGVSEQVLSDDGFYQYIRASVNTLGREAMFLRLVIE